MNLCGVVRALVDMGFDAVEAIAYAVFDFDDAADELWYRDDLVAKETEEGPLERAQRIVRKHFPPDSSSPSLVSAGGGEPAASAHSPSASQAAGNQTLSVNDLRKAANCAYWNDNEDGLWRRLECYADYLESLGLSTT